ncbi:MAG TPA: hypothetical protein VFI42_15900 [Thermomicrobiaceae bacterium]|nr:hypothetical protein [Thermomicrobiaceae bacterium]
MPTRTIGRMKVASANIVDASAFGRSWLTTADQASARGLLGVSDVGDLRNYAVADAIALLGLTRPQVVVEEPFNNQPGAANSTFSAVGGTLAQSSRGQGGWFQLTTAAGAGSNASCHNNQRQVLVTDVTHKKWYSLFLFALESAVNADSTLRLGLYDASLATTGGVYMGMFGGAAGSTTKFGFFHEQAGVTTGVLSSVNIDLGGIHLGRQYCDGAGNIYGSMDFEAAKTFVGASNVACMAHLQMLNGAGGGARSYSFGHALLITE